MSIETLADAFYDELCDIYHVEKLLLKAIPLMTKKATNKTLREILTTHLKETEQQLARIEAAFEDTGKFVKIGRCAAMEALLKEAQSLAEREFDPEVTDAVIVGLAQKIEHYEIAAYRTLWSWASTLGYKNSTEQLTAILAEEQNASKSLAKLSNSVNRVAELVSAV